MPARPRTSILDFVSLDPSEHLPLYHQLYTELRSGILNGRLPAHSKLPSSREVAEALAISRRPVREAYGFLLAEGLLESRRGAGTFVRGRPDGHEAKRPGEPAAPAAAAVLSARGCALVANGNYETRWTGAFAPTLPAADHFPRRAFARLLARGWRQADAAGFRKPPGAGLPALRQAIAGYLASTRGLVCAPEQVMVTAGSSHATGLLARLLANPGERAWTENPGWPTGRQILAANEVTPVPVPVDADGLDVEAGRALAPDARLALVTPTRQYPLGMGMSIARRLELLTWAQDQHSWIIEDDYDGEFQYSARVLPPLQTLDRHGRSIYMGSFSKVLTQALRLGYLVVPPALVEPVARALSHEKAVPTLAQAAVADFLQSGEFARHVRRMRVLYRARQEALVSALRSRLGGAIRPRVSDSGFHILASLPDGVDGHVVSSLCAGLGVYAPALDEYYHPHRSRAAAGNETGSNTLVLGFASLDEAELARGVAALADALSGPGASTAGPPPGYTAP